MITLQFLTPAQFLHMLTLLILEQIFKIYCRLLSGLNMASLPGEQNNEGVGYAAHHTLLGSLKVKDLAAGGNQAVHQPQCCLTQRRKNWMMQASLLWHLTQGCQKWCVNFGGIYAPKELTCSCDPVTV